MNFKLTAVHAAAAALALSALAAPALASNHEPTLVPLSFNVSGIQSFGIFGDAGNAVQTVSLAPGAIVSGVSWDVTLSATAPSWLNEMFVMLSNSAQSTGYQLFPAPTAEQSGPGHYTGSTALGANSFAVGANGLLRLEFAESLDDLAGQADGTWLSGTLTFEVSAVPEPATYASLALGLVLVGAAARRRSAR